MSETTTRPESSWYARLRESMRLRYSLRFPESPWADEVAGMLAVTVVDFIRANPPVAPSVSPVEAGEARRGDTWSLTGEIRETFPGGTVSILGSDGLLHPVPAHLVQQGTITRPVSRPALAGEASEVAPMEAREGDTVTTVRTGKVDQPNQVGTLGVIWDDEPGVVVTVRPWVTAITVTRPVSLPLPTEPGAVGTATVRGVPGIRIMREDVDPLAAAWRSFVQVQGKSWHAVEHITDYVEELPAPAGAGVSEGGKA